jgi:23S rRNA (uracil1939-C5)-methyltransferase
VFVEGRDGNEGGELVVFVAGGVTGDVVDVQVTKKKKNFAEARIVGVVEPSADRVTPFCQHFGTCGGCKWQHFDYAAQAATKGKWLTEALTRIGKLELPPAEPVLSAQPGHDVYYRNRLDFTASARRWLTDEDQAYQKTESFDLESIPEGFNDALGFHVPGMFDRVVDIERCWLMAEPMNAIRLAAKAFAKLRGWTFYDHRTHTGFFRGLTLRANTAGELMLLLHVAHGEAAEARAMVDHLVAAFPEIHSAHYVINVKKNDTIYDQDIVTTHGPGFLVEVLEDLKFKISPKSFFQTNSDQALALYRRAREYAGLTGTETVYDLYTGTGSIALFVSKLAAHVVGIEYVPEAIADAKENAELNGVAHCAFYAGDLKDMLTPELVALHGAPDVLITDPPRAGMHPDVVQRIAELKPARIVYVSCNPATQARDLALLFELEPSYRVVRYGAVDMFPHTHHVESVVLVERG